MNILTENILKLNNKKLQDMIKLQSNKVLLNNHFHTKPNNTPTKNKKITPVKNTLEISSSKTNDNNKLNDIDNSELETNKSNSDKDY